jgi:hypothetical protein
MTTDIHTCERCGHQGPEWQFDRHHPDRKNQPDLTELLCRGCHLEHHRAEKKSKGTDIHIRVPDTELTLWRSAAGLATLSAWIRYVCTERAALTSGGGMIEQVAPASGPPLDKAGGTTPPKAGGSAPQGTPGEQEPLHQEAVDASGSTTPRKAPAVAPVEVSGEHYTRTFKPDPKPGRKQK